MKRKLKTYSARVDVTFVATVQAKTRRGAQNEILKHLDKVFWAKRKVNNKLDAIYDGISIPKVVDHADACKIIGEELSNEILNAH